MSIKKNYEDSIQYLNDKVNFEVLNKPSQSKYKMSIDHLFEIDKKLGSPHQSLKIIHVAGTKGKGSVCCMLDFYLRSLGYHTGLFTSPHLYKVNERVRLNGKELSDWQFSEMIDDFRKLIDKQDDKKITYFETMTFAALLYLKKLKVDWVILETGLGGRLDSTNIVNPILSVITRIDLDHTHLLGNTHKLIAMEKAGIIKTNTPVVALKQRDDVNSVFEEIAYQKKSPLVFAPTKPNGLANITHLNSAETENLSVTKTVIEKLNEISKIELNTKKLQKLANLKIPGRYETFPFQNKIIMLDVAHNYISYEKLIEKVKQDFPKENIAFVFNSSKDKDIENMAKLVKNNFNEVYILPVKNNVRVFDPKELADKLLLGKPYSDFKTGMEDILKNTSANVIVFTGSFFLISEVGQYFDRKADIK